MSEEEKATARAEGALEDFVSRMAREMLDKEKSEEYKEAFWKALYSEMECQSDNFNGRLY